MCERLDDQNTSDNVVIVCSGGLSEEIIDCIDENRRRKSLVLGITIFCFKLPRWIHLKEKPIVNDVVNSIEDLVSSFIDHIVDLD